MAIQSHSAYLGDPSKDLYKDIYWNDFNIGTGIGYVPSYSNYTWIETTGNVIKTGPSAKFAAYILYKCIHCHKFVSSHKVYNDTCPHCGK